MDIYTIWSIVNLIISLLVIYYGFILVSRSSGKFKFIISFLVLIVVVILVHEIRDILGFFSRIEYLATATIILLLFAAAAIGMKKITDKFGESKRLTKKRKKKFK